MRQPRAGVGLHFSSHTVWHWALNPAGARACCLNEWRQEVSQVFTLVTQIITYVSVIFSFLLVLWISLHSLSCTKREESKTEYLDFNLSDIIARYETWNVLLNLFFLMTKITTVIAFISCDCYEVYMRQKSIDLEQCLAYHFPMVSFYSCWCKHYYYYWFWKLNKIKMQTWCSHSGYISMKMQFVLGFSHAFILSKQCWRWTRSTAKGKRMTAAHLSANICPPLAHGFHRW